MTFSLRRKRQTTVRGKSMLARMAASVLGLALHAGTALAQSGGPGQVTWDRNWPAPPSAPSYSAAPSLATPVAVNQPGQVVQFNREPVQLGKATDYRPDPHQAEMGQSGKVLQFHREPTAADSA